jgi:hypothetical protein
MRFLGIVGLGVAAGVAFGLVQMAVTAAVWEFRIVELIAFTVTGLLLGLSLAAAARLGRRPKRAGRSLVRPLVALLAAMGVFAAIAGGVGFTLARSGNAPQPPELQEQIPPAKWPGVQACVLAHMTSYYVAFVGGGMLVGWVWVSRKRLHPKQVAAG